MAGAFLGRSIRRLRQERGLTQAVLASKLGISPSYLNLIEHDGRPVTASLLIKLSRLLDVGLDVLSGNEEANALLAVREALTDPELGGESVSELALSAIAAHPDATRAILALSRALAGARDDAEGLKLPSGRRVRLPWEEARAVFRERSNHFPSLEQAAAEVRGRLGYAPGADVTQAGDVAQAEMNHAIAEHLRRQHGLVVRVVPLEGMLRHYDAGARVLSLSDLLRRESRGFQMAFQLMLFEARPAIEELLEQIGASSAEASALIRIGLLNYAAAALLMPYDAYLADAKALRYDVEVLAARYAVSYEQAAHRLSTLQAPGNRGVAFFFVRSDAAGNMTKVFSNAGFPFAQRASSCPLWIANTAFASSGQTVTQVALLPDGARFFCFARVVTGVATGWGDPPPRNVVTLGCEIGDAAEVVYADGIALEQAASRVGVGCRLCDWLDCRSRAYPPLHHRLDFDVNRRLASPMFSGSGRRP
jgi:predicted transcriptional regulator/DNA-binding XRE family transcriptional regulator